MNEKSRWLLLVLLMTVGLKPTMAFALRCSVGEPYAYTAPYDLQECPRDIQVWMDRVNGCKALDTDKAGATQDALDEEAAELECAFIACDYADLIKKYHGNGVLTNIVKGYKKVVFGENALTCHFEN
jgi:hypothetical protein